MSLVNSLCKFEETSPREPAQNHLLVDSDGPWYNNEASLPETDGVVQTVRDRMRKEKDVHKDENDNLSSPPQTECKKKIRFNNERSLLD